MFGELWVSHFTQRMIKSCRSQGSSDCSFCSVFHWPLMLDRCRWSFCLSRWSLDHRCPGLCWQVHRAPSHHILQVLSVQCQFPYISVHYYKVLLLLLRSGFTVEKCPGDFCNRSKQHTFSQGYDLKTLSLQI